MQRPQSCGAGGRGLTVPSCQILKECIGEGKDPGQEWRAARTFRPFVFNPQYAIIAPGQEAVG